MQSTLATITVIAALLGTLYAWFARRAAKEPSGWTVILREGLSAAPVLGVCITLLAFVCTLPFKPPFSHGIGLGWGILIGGLCALIALGEAAAGNKGEAWAARCVGLLSVAAIGPSLILILFRGDPAHALIGCAIGGATMVFGCLGVMAADPDEMVGPARRGMEAYLIASAGIVAGATLAMDRFPRATPFGAAGGYWAVPGLLTVVAALVLVLLAAGKGARLSPARFLGAGFACALAATFAAFILHWKLLPELAWTPFLFASVGFALIGLVFLNAAGERPTLPALAAACVALLVGALSWQASEAYGQALAVAAAAILVVVFHAGRTDGRSALASAMVSGGATLLTLMVWYRMFSEDTPRWRALDFQQHYQFVAVALGIGFVFAVLSLAVGRVGTTTRTQVWRTVGLGIAAVGAPLLLATLWGDRAVAAYLGGLLVSEIVWMMLVAWSVEEERNAVLAAAPHVYLLGSAFIAAHTSRVLIAFELTRVQKIEVIAGLAFVATVVYVVNGMRAGFEFCGSTTLARCDCRLRGERNERDER